MSRALSPVAFVISILALVVATSITSAYAAVKIGTAQLKNNAVTTTKIKNRTVRTADLSASAITSLRGKAGPRGPQGPGSVKIDRTIPVNSGNVPVTLPVGKLTLMCASNQLYTGISGTEGAAINPLTVVGQFQYDGDAVQSRSAYQINSISFSGGNVTRMWADFTVADQNAPTFGNLRIVALRTATDCRWQIQYIP